ncbi:UvrD-helicase domain-containing protein [Anaerococcus sp. AGMB00486]|uniref:DNA 3'-5' helicase n=2 Tax=Anaerococcus TaxID=165779 RepID=A0ABX2N8N0_9FIRM|nr:MULTISPECIES: UvrD-helicase domain-containing protein [Anaerococcus]MSS77278.1 AAA family ATPase [Anaerococcus porci]NVF10919.1 UvrD-helicase domain-containing protein [Anaerococcus faecalis]
MSKFNPTKDQALAINERGKNIIVSAAAGSGKTRVLVDRVVGLMLEEKISIKEMIIVTFTNKASVEMKDRIRLKLNELLNKENFDRSFIKEQIRSLNDAYIKTLHAFCADMLRENFYLVDKLSPSFKIASDSQEAILRKDAVDELFEENYAKDYDSFRQYLHNFAKSRNDEDAKYVIEKVYDFSQSQINPENWLDEKLNIDNDFNKFTEFIEKKVKDLLKKAIVLETYIIDRAMRDKYISMIEEDRKLFEKILTHINDGNWDRVVNLFDNSLARMVTKSKADDPYNNSYIKQKKNSYKDDYNALKEMIKNTDSITRSFFNPLEERLLKEINRLVKDFSKIYKRKKREKNYLDFSDMEHEFINLLENEGLRNKLKSEFKYIFFDEYQDSNDIQNYIVDKIKGDNNLFFVGDVKQSIYGFRNARPELFLEKLDLYEKDSKSTRINLSKNFRTDKDIIDFNNYIFDRLMTKDLSNIAYKDDNHRLNPHNKFDDPYPKVSIRALNKNIKEETYIVNEIENLIKSGIEYRDIAILLRSSSKSYLIENELKKASIPFVSDISKISFNTIEVDFFINILKYIANPKDDITLLAILRSEIFNFSEDDLSLIRLKGEGREFYKAFESYHEMFDDEIALKISDFLTIFTDFTYILSLSNLFDFANTIFEKSGLYDFLKARDRGDERVKNIEAFIELMDDYDKTNDNSLFGFLSYVDNLKGQNKGNLQSSRDLSDEEDLVRIMTIHKSKGLEFKVVILADSAKRFNTQNSKEDLLLDKDLGIGINVADWTNKVKISSIRRDLILEKSKLSDKREEMRVLYVALTRCERKLIIVGKKDLDEDSLLKLDSKDSLLDLNSYMDWIIKILMEDKIMGEFIDKDFTTDCFSGGSLEISYINEEIKGIEKEYLSVDDFIDSKSIDENIYKDLKKIHDFTYPKLDETNRSLKKSVTEIAKDFDKSSEGYEKSSFDIKEIELDFRKPSFIDDKIKLTPTDKGSLIHKVFQELEVKVYSENEVKEQLNKLVNLGKIKKDYLAYIEIDKILAFYNSKIIKDLIKKDINIKKEESFLMKYFDFYVNGQIDMMFEKDDVILIDFKTDTIKREGFYDRQLQIYKEAIEKALSKKVSKLYIYWYNFKEFEEINKIHH